MAFCAADTTAKPGFNAKNNLHQQSALKRLANSGGFVKSSELRGQNRQVARENIGLACRLERAQSWLRYR
jgi:hypothetical protein